MRRNSDAARPPASSARTFAGTGAATDSAGRPRSVTAAAAGRALVGCGGNTAGGGGDERPVVLTTFTVLADVAKNVAGDKLRVESITKAGAEIHGYEPTPGDIRKASQADLILDNGLNLEAWFAPFVEGLDEPARLDVAAERPGLCGQHGESLLRAGPWQRQGLRGERQGVQGEAAGRSG